MPVVCLAGNSEALMLSFKVSVIDVALILAVMVLLVLYLSKQPAKSLAKSTSVTEKKSVETPLRAGETQESIEEARLQTDSQISSLDCPQHLGYLKELPKDAQIPDECYRCPKMMECS